MGRRHFDIAGSRRAHCASSRQRRRNCATDSSVGQTVAERVAPGRGQHLVDLASPTVRAVAKGVLGVAAIEAALAWVGMAVAGLPTPGAWALLVLICAVAQLPTFLVLGPMIVYVFASYSTKVAVPFMVWSMFVGVVDNVLKPILLGRGAGVPTLVSVI